MKGENFVLYASPADGGARRVIGSCDVSDSAAALRFAHMASAEYRRCDQAGVPIPSLKVVREVREAGEDGKQLSARFIACDPGTLRPLVEGDRGARDLDDLFKKENA